MDLKHVESHNAKKTKKCHTSQIIYYKYVTAGTENKNKFMFQTFQDKQ